MLSATDADVRLVEAINRSRRSRLRVVGRATEGTSGGAILVEFPDSAPGVVTRFLGDLARAEQTRDVINAVRSHGLPVPRHHDVVGVDGSIFLVQEALPGRPPVEVTREVIDRVVEVNDRFAHALADREDVPQVPLCLTTSGDPHPRHEVLAEHSPRSRRILQAIREAGRHHPGDLAGDDLVQVDLDLSNVLFDDHGDVVGVVDWNLGVFRGDRHLALVKTRFEQEWALHEPARNPQVVRAAAHLDHVLDERVAADDLRWYWAHRLLGQLHWVLSSGSPEVVSWHLEVAEERLL